MTRARTFLVLWTLVMAATTAAFSVRLAIRGRSVEIGYELGRTYGHIERLREVRRVLELELMSQKTPERVGLVARSLLGMAPPSPDRILPAGTTPEVQEARASEGLGSRRDSEDDP